MRFLLISIFLPLLILAEPGLIWRFGERKSEDRALGIYHETQGPFSENQTITFNFEHQLNGKFFTAFVLTGEPLFVRKQMQIDKS